MENGHCAHILPAWSAPAVAACIVLALSPLPFPPSSHREQSANRVCWHREEGCHVGLGGWGKAFRHIGHAHAPETRADVLWPPNQAMGRGWDAWGEMTREWGCIICFDCTICRYSLPVFVRLAPSSCLMSMPSPDVEEPMIHHSTCMLPGETRVKVN